MQGAENRCGQFTIFRSSGAKLLKRILRKLVGNVSREQLLQKSFVIHPNSSAYPTQVEKRVHPRQVASLSQG